MGVLVVLGGIHVRCQHEEVLFFLLGRDDHVVDWLVVFLLIGGQVGGVMLVLLEIIDFGLLRDALVDLLDVVEVLELLEDE